MFDIDDLIAAEQTITFVDEPCNDDDAPRAGERRRQLGNDRRRSLDRLAGRGQPSDGGVT